ncbi:carboxyl-terminal processing protease [Filimonas lacunae]|uniref:Carboxyl-terminal processing protease n=1 Tax=Filimonas lacunae TaxID=477680 RepID=A0A173MFY2_9BACT|nr:carboxy terminal-processing peptidase [Filimonas lacunae]BAV06390.1 tail-specific protease precursor [Filimonas lacunae]SIT26762.1 carboxyl-terminal processing protease [Filimonas lacunae]
MMSRKVLPFIIIVLCGLGLWAFRYRGEDETAMARRQQLLATVGYILEQKHYDPKLIDDSFSKDIFKKYIESLDPEKNIYLASDIASLKKYETTIDDEIHGAPIGFFATAGDLYTKRMGEITTLYKEIMAKPFDFSVNEKVQLEADSLDYVADEQARKENWRKRLKYLTLDRFADLQDARAKSKATDSIHSKTDTQLEKDARDKVVKLMDRNFNRLKKRLTQDEQFNLFVNTITGAMDPHTNYLPPLEKRAFDEEMSNRFYGIGAQLREEDAGGVKVISVVPGSPAWKSGQIQVNDLIIKVAQGSAEPVDITGLGVDDAVKLIRGNKGTEVKLTLKRPDGNIKVVSLLRDEIVQDEAFARSVILNNGNKKIGYIYLPEFYADFERANGSRCAADVATEVIKLKSENVDGIVLDLRSNGGGSLYEVVQMVGLFINNGPVVQVKDRDGKPSILNDENNDHLYDGPLAVMVNELSASASEIFAAAIQDYKRGIIVGSTSTFGKGTVQKNLPLGKPIDMFSGRTEYGALKLTFEKFYRINGGSTQLKGVASDIVLPDLFEYQKFREKDYTSALQWDQIPKLTYNTWDKDADINTVKKASEQRISNSYAFKAIKNSAEWANANANKEVSLNITQFRDDQKKAREMSKLSDSALKLTKNKELNVQVLKADKEKYYNNPDKAKGERYQDWLKRLKTDLYIDETMRIVTDMAAGRQQNVARQ